MDLGSQDQIASKHGLAEESRLRSGGVLTVLLASEYVLYVKTQNAHWNLTGPLFSSLHKLFGDQYKELADFIDRIAEQIRKYGVASIGSMQEFVKFNLGRQEIPGRLVPGLDLVKELLASNEDLIENINRLQENDDYDLATQNLLGDLLDFHLKNSWMLRVHLE